jgi:hypothetical protein
MLESYFQQLFNFVTVLRLTAKVQAICPAPEEVRGLILKKLDIVENDTVMKFSNIIQNYAAELRRYITNGEPCPADFDSRMMGEIKDLLPQELKNAVETLEGVMKKARKPAVRTGILN